jgi:hypothetical protein
MDKNSKIDNNYKIEYDEIWSGFLFSGREDEVS